MTKPLVVALLLAGLTSAAMAGTVALDTPAKATAAKPAAPMIAVTPAPARPVPAAAPVTATPGGAPVNAAPAVARADSRPVVQDPGAMAASPPVAPDPAGDLVNPFNGKPLSADQLQLELERSKYKTQLLEEQLKQTNAAEEIKNVPGRKAVEAAQFRTAEKKEEAAIKDIETGMKAKAAVAEPPPVAKPVKKSAKALAKERAEAAAAARRASEEAAAQAAATPPAQLVSVMLVGSSRAVVLEVNGAVATVSDGDQSPVGPVHILDSQTANIGGRVYRVHDQTLSRFVVSDPKPVAPGAMGATGAVTATNVTTLPPAIPPSPSSTLPPPPIPGLTNNAGTSGVARIASALSGPGQNGIPPVGH